MEHYSKRLIFISIRQYNLVDYRRGNTTESISGSPLYSHRAGIPIRTTLDNSTTVQYSGLYHQLTAKAR